MIVELNQTKSFKDLEWLFKENGDNLAVAKSPFETGRFQIYLQSSTNNVRLYYNPLDTTYGKKLENRLCFHIFNETERIGYIVGRTKGFLFKGYAYSEMSYQNKIYQSYEVGLGKKGLFLCIYLGNSLIATVQKANKVIDFKDNYMLYLKSDEYFFITALFTLYYDTINYDNILERSVHSSSTTIKFTRNKELISKFDPMFIDHVKKADNPYKGGNNT